MAAQVGKWLKREGGGEGNITSFPKKKESISYETSAKFGPFSPFNIVPQSVICRVLRNGGEKSVHGTACKMQCTDSSV